MNSDKVDCPFSKSIDNYPINLLRCPSDHSRVIYREGKLISEKHGHEYDISRSGIPLFVPHNASREAKIQEVHYDQIAEKYAANLDYPHTRVYMAYLDWALKTGIGNRPLGTIAEICCGDGQAFHLFGDKIERGIGVDISVKMLERAQTTLDRPSFSFAQGDATNLPLADESFDTVLMLGGIHHINDRTALFTEVLRILKPGGFFYYREPVSDFFLWHWLRSAIYRLSPVLDHETEHPLRFKDTVPLLEEIGLTHRYWRTHGFIGFCILMNSDVLVINSLFRFIPGIRLITRAFTILDEASVRIPGLRRAGLQVVGSAQKSP